MNRAVAGAAIAAGALAVAVALVVSDSPEGSDRAERAEAAAPRPTLPVGLPPGDTEGLQAALDPLFTPMGLRLTRGGLQGPPEGASGVGRHLALYVEPLDAGHAPADYVQTLVASAKAVLPLVFDRWPGLESMDICQEPPPGVDDAEAPPPVTIVAVSKEVAATIDWAALDLSGFMLAADAGLMQLTATPAIEATEAWAAARSEADDRKHQE